MRNGAIKQRTRPVPPEDADAATPPPPAATAASGIRLTPDLMDEAHRQAVAQAAEELIRNKKLLPEIWPGAHDARDRKGIPLDLGEVELVVLHLDRIGAPKGASGAQVFAAYFAHQPPPPAESGFLPSPPLIMKLGDPDELMRGEYQFIEKWPTLTGDVRARLALPMHLSQVGSLGVLWSPFRSDYRVDQSGKGQRLGLADLWTLLNSPGELENPSSFDAGRIGRLVGDALHIMAALHRANRARYGREEAKYGELYKWYLRDTTTDGHRRQILLDSLFGDGATTRRFGQDWPNPRKLIAKIVDEQRAFRGILGPGHGDLHPKNIVLGLGDSVHIIDFGWARERLHVVVDYVLLDINLRSITLPSQMLETDILRLAAYLTLEEDAERLPDSVRGRARVIRDAIWDRAVNVEKVVQDWRAEYLIPYFIVAYGLLVYLDAARNQEALIATVLAAAKEIEAGWNDS